VSGVRSDALRFLVFFFQAEDGIRDWSVTGVQTCALPILSGRLQRPWLGQAGFGRAALAVWLAGVASCRIAFKSRLPNGRDRTTRLEERRVGEGGGCREWRGE